LLTEKVLRRKSNFPPCPRKERNDNDKDGATSVSFSRERLGQPPNQLNTFLKKNPGISSNDQSVAKELIQDLKNSVNGK
jgi:hypothetical protein